jgi:hypothetical protein
MAALRLARGRLGLTSPPPQKRSLKLHPLGSGISGCIPGASLLLTGATCSKSSPPALKNRPSTAILCLQLFYYYDISVFLTFKIMKKFSGFNGEIV